MKHLPLDQLVSDVIGGGWGDEEQFNGAAEVRVIRGADFPDVLIQDGTSLPIRYEEPKRAANRLLQPGDIVLEVSGGTKDRPTGRVVLVTQKLVDSAGSDLIPASFCRRLRPRPDVVDSRYLYYSLSNWWKQGGAWEYQLQSTGIANFQYKVFSANYTLGLPDKQAQRAIGEVLGALDDKIAANRRVIGSSVALATQIVAREAVGPDRQLSEIADVQMGSSPRGADLNEDGDGMEFYQGVRDFGPLSPTPRVFATVTPRRANAGDTLLAVRAPVGEVNWARNETCIGRGLAAVRSVGTPTTIHYLLKRFASRWDEHEGSGTVFSSVTGPQVKGMRFPTVPEASAEDVEQVVASIHHRALSAEAESEVLARTRDELLPLLMNGRISVKDAERVVGDVV